MFHLTLGAAVRCDDFNEGVTMSGDAAINVMFSKHDADSNN